MIKDNQKGIMVLYCPSSVAGAPQAMAHYDRLMGVNAVCYSYFPHPFGYRDHGSQLIFGGKNFLVVVRQLFRFCLAIFRSDVIHFNFGHSVLPSTLDTTYCVGWRRYCRAFFNFVYGPLEMIDLLILRWCGKKMIMLYQGSDARQEAFCRENHETTFVDSFPAYNALTDRQKRQRIRKVGKWCHRIVTVNPDLMGVLPRRAEFEPYSNIAIDLNQPRYPRPLEYVRVLHAPSNRTAKGSNLILSALEDLRNEGVQFKLDLVEEALHEELMEAVRGADLVIDQLLSGWYGGLAVEAMSFGKPVACYIRESDLVHIPDEMKFDFPLIQITPDTLKETLREILTTRMGELGEIGEKSRCYVEKWHCPQKLARARLKMYKELVEEAGNAV